MLFVTVLAVRLTIMFNQECGIESFVAHYTGKASLVVRFGGGTDDLFGEIYGGVAACALWCCGHGEARHVDVEQARLAEYSRWRVQHSWQGVSEMTSENERKPCPAGWIMDVMGRGEDAVECVSMNWEDSYTTGTCGGASVDVARA